MSDERFLLPENPKPEPTQQALHPIEQRRANLAILIATFAAFIALAGAGFAGWQAWEAHMSRIDAKMALDAQGLDVERSRLAAERSAEAAQFLAQGMNRSAAAAEASATSGKESLELSRRTLLATERPKLTVAQGRLVRPLTVGEKPTLQVAIVNGGRGVALSSHTQTWLKINPDFNFPYPPTNDTSIVDIGPNGLPILQIELSFPEPLDDKIIKLINSRNVKLYIYGVSKYRDDTDGKLSKEHKLTWCMYYLPSDTISEKLANCPVHNKSEW